VSKQGWYTVYPNEGYAALKVANDLQTRRTKRDAEDMPLNRPININCNGTEKTSAGTLWNIFKVEEEYDLTTIPGMPNPLPGPFS
jgi:hypothetical protein